MKKPKLRELGEAIKALIKGPVTTNYPFEEAEIIDEFRGKPEYIEDKCILCGACAEVCPVDAIHVDDYVEVDEPKREITRKYGECIYCNQCLAHCTTGDAIEFTKDFSLATLDREESYEEIDDQLILCERCGEKITTKKHLLWMAEKLGTEVYCNETITVLKMRELGLVDEIPTEDDREKILREDHYKILCPDCTRDVYAREEWGY